MDVKALRPKVFAADPHSKDAKREWLHWHKSFTTYVRNLGEVTPVDKLNLLVNHVDAAVYELFVEASTYDEAIASLKALCAKPQNSIFARYLLRSRKQVSEEPLDEYLQNLKRLSMDCDFIEVSAAQHKEEAIRDAFISGLQSKEIRQRLLEEKDITLQDTVDKALSLEAAQKNVEKFNSSVRRYEDSVAVAAASANRGNELVLEDKLETIQCTAALAGKCSYCGNKRHERSRCPAKDKVCFKCEKRGHFSKVCRSRSVNSKSSCASSLLMQIKPESTDSASKLNIPVQINGVAANALVDTGSTLSHLSERFVKVLDLK